LPYALQAFVTNAKAKLKLFFEVVLQDPTCGGQVHNWVKN